MRNLPIAYGNSCFARTWSNKTTTWEELTERLKTTIRTTESVEEYQKMKKDDRDRAKDKGGFVAGQLKNNRRKRENVVSRSMITLDADQPEPGFIEEFIEKFSNAACLYSTHSHTPENPRCRIIIPLARDISPDEFVAMSRYIAESLGIDQFDECSYRPHQLMYWPTTPSNGEYIYKKIEGEWLDPDEYLKKYPNWRDCSLLPTSSRESTVRENTGKKQEDPLTKKGTTGAFCNCYPMSLAIPKFLPNIYAPSVIEGRYDYMAGEGKAGVVVYDDKFAYSHHATDPASGKLLNAFDLVRVHLFGDDDEKKSFKQMAEFAISDDAVKEYLARERMQEAEGDFAESADWTKLLKRSPRTGELENSVWNLNLILENDPDYADFAYNEMANRVQITGKLPWDRPGGNEFWRDADTCQLKSRIDIRYGEFSTRNYDVSFTKVADDRHFHPVRDYLDSLPEWDGIPRVEDIFIRYLKAEDSPYVRAVTRKTFAAAVARIYEPGTKFDCVPVLDGDQGIGKSTIVKDLVTPEYYSESLSLTDMDDKAGAEKLQGFWMVEIGELAGMKKADIEKVKSFLSTADDKYRPSYGKVVESHPRQCVIIGTVNGERGYLRDITGNRRFWIIKVHQTEQKKSWNFNQEYRDQFWAEAKEIWEAGEKLYLEGDILAAAEVEQRNAMEQDERLGIVESYLNRLLPENWNELSLYARRDYLSGDPTYANGTVKRETVCNAEIWCECFGKNLSELKSADSYSIAALMTQLPGWRRTKDRCNLPIYGRQRVYKLSK